MVRKHFLVVLAEAMWQLHAQEKDWDELNAVETEQMLAEAQHCFEALQDAGYAIITQATPEEFEKAQRKLARQRGDMPRRVTGTGLFPLPGERRAWQRAEQTARDMLASIDKDRTDG